MKKSWVLLAIIAICVLGCDSAKEEEEDNRPFDASEPYPFLEFSDPEFRKAFNSQEEMLAACQLPTGYLKQASTENLIASCMNYPLFAIYFAYDNPLDGINVIINNFNGFKELRKRESAAEMIIDYYATMEVETTDSPLPVNNSIFHLGFLELVLASEIIPDMFSNQNIIKLEKAVSLKFQDKLKHPDVYSESSLKWSLLIGAEICLHKNQTSFKDKGLLQFFIKNGGNVDSKVYAYVLLLLQVILS
ncbi:MAG: hypothetical protein LBU22_10650 [Dysgonamonadaceae bacterium]|jgi:hypothetical protein|nr:hypothetical protein [Dysgonamonadaceae bacterium]